MSKRFLRHALVMMTGTVLAQAVPILVAPILTRLYSPEDYGLLVAFVGAASVLAVLATFRYELAIVLPESDDEARAIARLAGRLLIGSCLVYGLVIASFAERIAGFAGRPGETGWIYSLVPMVAMLGVFQIASYVGTRNRQFTAIATVNVLQQLVFSGLGILLGWLVKLPSGLVLARLCGQSVGTLLLSPVTIARWWSASRRFGLREVAVRYRQFPAYNCPYSLVGTLGREFFVLALTAGGQLGAAGLYGLARGVVFVPVGFLSASLSNVFYKESATALHTKEFGKLTADVTRIIGLIFTPAFAVLPVFASELFAGVFGPDWREAGSYAAWLTAPAFLFLFSSWPERIFEVASHQRISFFIQVVFDVLAATTVLFMLALSIEPIRIMPVLAGISCLYHFAYIAAAFKIARFEWEVFKPIVWRISLLAIAWLGVALVIKLMLTGGVSIVSALVGLLAIYYARLGRIYGRELLARLGTAG